MLFEWNHPVYAKVTSFFGSIWLEFYVICEIFFADMTGQAKMPEKE